MRIAATIAVGILLLLLEAIAVELFDLSNWLPHVASGIVVYLALRKELFEACIEVAALAWIADLLAVAPPGVVALAITVVFFGVRIASVRLTFSARIVRVALAVLAAAAVQIVAVGVVAALTGELRLVTALVLAGLPSALLAPVGFLVSWLALARVDKVLAPRQRGLLRE